MTKIFLLHVIESHGGAAAELFQTREDVIASLLHLAADFELDEDETAPDADTVIQFLVDHHWDVDIHEIDLPTWLKLYPKDATDADKRAIDASRGGLRH